MEPGRDRQPVPTPSGEFYPGARHHSHIRDLISAAVYDGRSEDMAFSVDGKRNIHAISKMSFEKSAKEIELGAKIAMNRFDAMVSDFEKHSYLQAKNLKSRELRDNRFCVDYIPSGISPLSFKRSSTSVPLTFFMRIRSASCSQKLSFTSVMGFLSMP